ncbi:hypothetical protein MKW92_047177 [Papaver armeniacum]|nr:hypothetical protein MKW92_047177 [Papaver armeniacum]
MGKFSFSCILLLVGLVLLVIAVSAATDNAAVTGFTPPEGSECPMRDAAKSNGTDRGSDGLSCDGCMKSCFKKCGKSKSKTPLACRQMTITKWSCGCCCSKD